MSPKDIVLNQYASAQWLYESALKDLSDADCRFQPFTGANHVNWILAHLAVSEDSLIAKITGGPMRYKEALHKAYGGGSQCNADDGMTRAEAWKMYTESGRHTTEFVKSFAEARYDDPSPESLRQMFPTVGAVVGLLGAHPYWHFGQVTFNRRALKKPLMFGA
jgi:hypothetical protein